MAGGKFELFGTLRRKGRDLERGSGARGRDRMLIHFTVPSITWDLSLPGIRAALKPFAELLQMDARFKLLSGRDLGGKALPAASAATIDRRRYRKAQAARGGQVAERYKDPEVRARGRRNYDRRFTAALSGSFPPDGRYGGGAWLGVESGLLALTIVVAPLEQGWGLFVANARGVLDRGGDSALGRVFRRVGAWSRDAMAQPEIQAGLRAVQDAVKQVRSARFASLVRSIRSDVSGIAQQTEAIGQAQATEYMP